MCITESDPKILKSEIVVKWKYLSKKLAYLFEFIKCIDDFQKLVKNFEKEDFFSNLKNACPIDEEIEASEEITRTNSIKKHRRINKFFFKTDVLLLTSVFGKLLKKPKNELNVNPLYCVNLPSFTWQHGSVQ